MLHGSSVFPFFEHFGLKIVRLH